MAAPGFTPNPSTLLSTTVDDTWRDMVPALETETLAPAGGGKRLRRFTGGWVYNADNATRIVQLATYDGTTRTTFRNTSIETLETLILNDDDDGFEFSAQNIRIQIRTTTAPTTDLSCALTHEDT